LERYSMHFFIEKQETFPKQYAYNRVS